MKRPSFQFYPGDWTSDLKLRRCSPAARGVWMDVLCAFHDSDDGYGLLRWPLKDIASTVGASMPHMRELVEKGVLRGSDTHLVEPFVYTPRSGRKDGEPVTLIDTNPGPVWYSQRMVKDEYVRTIRGESSRFGVDDGVPLKTAPKPPKGDGTTSPSSSSTSVQNTKLPDGSSPSKAPPLPAGDCPHQELIALWAEVLPAMPQVQIWNATRASHLRARWKETAVDKGWTSKNDGILYFRKLFHYLAKSPFLMGKVAEKDRRAFTVELPWLICPQNWAKVHEGKYHEDAA